MVTGVPLRYPIPADKVFPVLLNGNTGLLLQYNTISSQFRLLDHAGFSWIMLEIFRFF